jgi:hypothetical protein
MTCPLTDTDCSAIRRDLTDEALRWWSTHEDTLRALTRTELEALAEDLATQPHPAGHAAQGNLLTAWRVEAGYLYEQGDPTLLEAWQAMRRNTTEGLSDLARQRYETRKAIISAILDLAEGVASVILPRVGEALLQRLRP